MHKKLLAIFSVSITAGTLYFSYWRIKEYQIKKLLSLWRSNQPFDETVARHLLDELRHLNVFDLRLLKEYSDKKLMMGKQSEMQALSSKIKEKKIRVRVDLSAVEDLLF